MGLLLRNSGIAGFNEIGDFVFWLAGLLGGFFGFLGLGSWLPAGYGLSGSRDLSGDIDL